MNHLDGINNTYLLERCIVKKIKEENKPVCLKVEMAAQTSQDRELGWPNSSLNVKNKIKNTGSFRLSGARPV